MDTWFIPMIAGLLATLLLAIAVVRVKAAKSGEAKRRDHGSVEVTITRRELDPSILARTSVASRHPLAAVASNPGSGTAILSQSTFPRPANATMVSGPTAATATTQAARIPKAGEWQFRNTGPLLSKTERGFLERLEQVIAGRCRVAVQVHLGGIIQPREPLPPPVWARHRGMLHRRLDYVLCSHEYEVIGVVELDDWTHTGRSQSDKDRILDAALGSAGIPILRIHPRQTHDWQGLQSMLQRSFRLA